MPVNVQMNQVAGPSRLPLAPVQRPAPLFFTAAPVSTILFLCDAYMLTGA